MTPLDGARTSAGTSVIATFSEPIDQATLRKATVQRVEVGTAKSVPAEITYDPTARKVILQPTRKLLSGATYRVTVTRGVKDLAGNALAAGKVWEFGVR